MANSLVNRWEFISGSAALFAQGADLTGFTHAYEQATQWHTRQPPV